MPVPPNLDAEATGTDDEVMVTVETVPLTGNGKISVELTKRQTLRISCEDEMIKRMKMKGIPDMKRKFSQCII